MKLQIAESYERGQPTGTVVLAHVQGKWVEIDTAFAFLRMARAAKREGIDLELTDGFRFPADQHALWFERMDQPTDSEPMKRKKAQIRRVKGIAARPGWSRHQNGTAVDVLTGLSAAQAARGETSPTYEWIRKNAPRFGFAVGVVPNEPWHLERVFQPDELVI